jgi:hypothetical protein
MKENFHVVDNEEDFEKCKGYFEENPPIHGMGGIVNGDSDGNGAWKKGYINSTVAIGSSEWVYNKTKDTIDATNNTDFANYFIDVEPHYYINNIANIGYFEGDAMNDSIGVIFYTEFTGEDGELYCDNLTVECGNRVKNELNNSISIGVARRKKSATNNNDSSNLIKYFQLIRSELRGKTFEQAPYLVRGDELVKVTATNNKQTYFTAVNTVKKGKTIAFYFSEKAFDLSVADKQQPTHKDRSVIFDLNNYTVQINGYSNDGTNTPFTLEYNISTTPMSYNTDNTYSTILSEPHPTQWDDGDDITDIWRNIAENGCFGYYQASTPEGRVYNIQYIEGDNVVYNNLILRNDTNEVYELNGSTFDVLSGSIPVDYFTGSHISYNEITEKLWYSNGTEITQIATNCGCGESSDSNNPGSDITCNCIEYSGGTNIEIVDGVINCTLSALTTDLITKVTYNDLCGLINSKTLTPGMKYRITDYVTTVNSSLTDVQSAGHVFDIIVESTDVDKLSENAKAIQSVRDVDGYFAEVNLDAWELKYSVDNDTDRFAWADSTNGKGVIYFLKDEHNNECPYDFKNIQFKRWAITDITSNKLTTDDVNELKNIYCKTQNGGKYYATKDVYGKWVPQNNNETEWVIDENDYTWYYTFHGLSSEDGETISGQYDMSTKVIKLSDEYLQQLENDGSGSVTQDMCKENHIQSSYYEYFGDDEYTKGRIVLNNIVFVNGLSYCYYIEDEGYWSYQLGHCYGNKFGVECKNNTFGNYCYNNILGNGCYYNTFGNNCYQNTFGNDVRYNTFGNSCWNNTFGNSCYRNILGNGCGGNTFGNDVNNNTFGNECWDNTFGNYFQYNTFGNDVRYNTFGNSCYRNILGNNVNNNTFGNNCGSNTFGNGYIKECRFGNGVQYCTISGYNTGNGNYIRNIVVLNGTKGSYNQLLELNQNQIFNTHNFKRDSDLVPQIVCGFFVNENNVITYIAKYYFDATLG